MHYLSGLLSQPYAEFVPYMLSRKWDITDKENYWYRRGTTDYALVAHVDTLCAEPHRMKLRINKKGFISNKTGILGADDRAGVWLISQLLDLNPHVFLFNYEEFGGVGVNRFLKEHEFPSGIKFLIEFDRRGYDEYVYYSPTHPVKLCKWAEVFGFSEGWGSYSDVSDITNATRIPHLNMSAAFTGEHTSMERLHWPTLQRLSEKYHKMLLSAPKNVEKLPKPRKRKIKDTFWKNSKYLWDDRAEHTIIA